MQKCKMIFVMCCRPRQWLFPLSLSNSCSSYLFTPIIAAECCSMSVTSPHRDMVHYIVVVAILVLSQEFSLKWHLQFVVLTRSHGQQKIALGSATEGCGVYISALWSIFNKVLRSWLDQLFMSSLSVMPECPIRPPAASFERVLPQTRLTLKETLCTAEQCYGAVPLGVFLQLNPWCVSMKLHMAL